MENKELSKDSLRMMRMMVLLVVPSLVMKTISDVSVQMGCCHHLLEQQLIFYNTNWDGGWSHPGTC